MTTVCWERRPEPRPCSYWTTVDDVQYALLPEVGGHSWDVVSFGEAFGVNFIDTVPSVEAGKRVVAAIVGETG